VLVGTRIDATTTAVVVGIMAGIVARRLGGIVGGVTRSRGLHHLVGATSVNVSLSVLRPDERVHGIETETGTGSVLVIITAGEMTRGTDTGIADGDSGDERCLFSEWCIYFHGSAFLSKVYSFLQLGKPCSPSSDFLLCACKINFM
jgi:hypothetical protein